MKHIFKFAVLAAAVVYLPSANAKPGLGGITVYYPEVIVRCTDQEQGGRIITICDLYGGNHDHKTVGTDKEFLDLVASQCEARLLLNGVTQSFANRVYGCGVPNKVRTNMTADQALNDIPERIPGRKVFEEKIGE